MDNSLKNILSWIIKICLFIIPFIPLYIATNLFFPFIVGKAVVFRVVVELAFVLWLALVIFYKEYRPQKNVLLWCIAAFVLITLLATVFGVNPLRSFWSNFERMEGFVTYMHLFAYFLVLGNVFKKKDWFILFNLFVLVGWLSNIYALLQASGIIASPQGGFRVDGTIGNPAYLAAYLIFILGFAAILFAESKNFLARIYYGISGLFTLLIIYFTASRGPTLGLLLSLFVLGLIYLFVSKPVTDKEKLLKKSVLWTLVGLLVVVVGIWMLRDSSFVKTSPVLSRLTSLSFTDKTISARFSVWKMSFEAFKENPILGWGPENYVVVFSKYYTPEMWQQEPWFDRSHNIVFDWLINAGLLGLLSYIAMFAAAIYCLFKNYQDQKYSTAETLLIAGIFVAYCFQNLFIFDNIATYSCLFTLFAYIYSANRKEEVVSRRNNAENISDEYLMPVALVALILFVFIAYSFVFKPFSANRNLLDALTAAARGNITNASELFSKSLATNTFVGKSEIRAQFISFATENVLPSSELDDNAKSQILFNSVKEMDQDRIENVLDPRPPVYLGIIYNTIKQYDKAIESYNEALKLSPKKQDILFVLADTYINKGEYQNAISALEQAFNEAPEYKTARVYLAGAYILNGQQTKADALLMEGFGKTNVPEDFLAKVYYRAKDYSRLIGIRQAFVESDPKNTSYLKSLAGAYLLVGQQQEAINALEKAISIQPSFEQEGRSYIDQIRAGTLK